MCNLYINLACLSVCLFGCLFLCCRGLSGHFSHTEVVIRTGCQDHRVHSRVIRTLKRLSGPFFNVSAKTTKQTNTFIGFSEYVSIPIRLYTEIECHI